MVRFLTQKFLFGLAKRQGSQTKEPEQAPPAPLAASLPDNLNRLKKLTGGSRDVIFREFMIGRKESQAAALIYVDGMTNTEILNNNIIRPLMSLRTAEESGEKKKTVSLQDLAKKVLSVGEVTQTSAVSTILEGLLNGNAVLLLDETDSSLILNSKGWEQRGIDVPSSESVIRGPRESFTENLITNTSMIRRKIKNPDLTVEATQIGARTRTGVCLVYIKSLANPKLIQNIKDRMKAIQTDSILESGYIEQYIEDAPFSIFPTVGHTEKPDVAAAKLLEGRVAILVDGTPFVLTAPIIFIENFQSAEDYYSRPYYMSLVRIIRYLAFIITVFVPALYVAITTYDQELIPTNLLFTMTAARESIPFPAIAEAFIMLAAFEILREAGIRLPQPIGQAMSIVGALVIGEAAVSAGIVSAPMVIVVAITSVSVFAVPQLSEPASILRLLLLILAGTLGGYGITIGTLGVMVHLASLKSFGCPFLSPVAPFQAEDSKDSLFRFPLWMMISRPRGMSGQDGIRQKELVPPAAPLDDSGEK